MVKRSFLCQLFFKEKVLHLVVLALLTSASYAPPSYNYLNCLSYIIFILLTNLYLETMFFKDKTFPVACDTLTLTSLDLKSHDLYITWLWINMTLTLQYIDITWPLYMTLNHMTFISHGFELTWPWPYITLISHDLYIWP